MIVSLQEKVLDMAPFNVRLLVVDDDPGIREYLMSRLVLERYKVCETENADMAPKA